MVWLPWGIKPGALALVWMRCDKTSDNHLHERTLRTIYNDNVSTLEKLLEKDNFVTVHVRNLRILAIK